ncbi:MAG: ribose-phosphate pyrophosphokinase [Polymorphobacter sp.]|uniref:ribose-phosphate pyrophosphokinase n=1 Tax=Polymorphobacter sp. TaxID=1909290 RepID=UPI003A83D10B
MAEGLFDVDEVEALMRAAARAGTALSYSDALGALGFAFSRPKMRALCAVLDRVDERAAAVGEPELAVLVVRASDGLPGQGWWVGRRDWNGLFEGPDAARFVAEVQGRAFAYWRGR